MSTKNQTKSTIPATRVSQQLMISGVNAANADKLIKLEAELLALRKAGTAKPAPLERISRKASKAEQTAHKAAQEKHAAEVKEYTKFTSKEYAQVKRQSKLLRVLESILEFHAKQAKRPAGETPTKTDLADLESALAALRATKPEPKEGEDPKLYSARVARFEKVNFTTIVQQTKLDKVDMHSAECLPKVQAVVDKLRTVPKMQLFIELHKLNSDNFRGGDANGQVLASALNSIVGVLIVGGLQKLSKSHTKLQISDIVQGYEPGSFADAVQQLPIWKIAADRTKREVEHEANEELFVQNAMRADKAAGIQRKRSDVVATYPSFGAAEVAAGHATSTERQTKPKGDAPSKTKTIYSWPDLDWQADADRVDYTAAIKGMVHESRDMLYPYGSPCASSTVSRSTLQFLSDITSQFVGLVAKNLALSLDVYGAKTLRPHHTMCAVRQVFQCYALDSNPAIKKLIANMEAEIPAGKASASTNASPKSVDSAASSSAASPAPAAAEAAADDEDDYDDASDTTPAIPQAAAKAAPKGKKP